ncbi:MAG: HEAT repeat domain-containing protein, partial [Myxococcaceae bacterium]
MAVVLAASGCQTPPKRKPVNNAAQEQAPNPIERIADLEDRRALGDLPQIATNDPNPVMRARAYLALGRLQDPSTAQTIAVGISDVAPLPRFEAAFAAGLIGLSWDPVAPEVKIALVEKLLTQEAQEQEAKVHYEQLEALARLATPAAVDRLVDRLLGTTPDVQARASLLLGVAVRQNATIPAKAFTALAPLLKKESPADSRYGAAYALAASKNPLARTQLLLCTQDEASEVRAICAKGLGDVGTDVDAVTLRKLLDDSDYRVAVEATRSLAKLAEKCKAASCAPVGALADLSFRAERLEHGDVAGGAQPLLALAQSGLPATQGKVLLQTLRDRVRAAARNAATPKLKADIANIDCRLSAAMDRQLGTLKEVLTCGGDLVPEAKRLAMGISELARTPAKDPNKRVEEIAPYLRHADSSVKLATVNALAENNSPAAIDRLRSMLNGTDLVVTASV